MNTNIEETTVRLLLKKVDILNIELAKQSKAINERLAKVDYFEQELKKYIAETSDIVKKYQEENVAINELKKAVAELQKKAHEHKTTL